MTGPSNRTVGLRWSESCAVIDGCREELYALKMNNGTQGGMEGTKSVWWM